jgi:hypothetical protein
MAMTKMLTECYIIEGVRERKARLFRKRLSRQTRFTLLPAAEYEQAADSGVPAPKRKTFPPTFHTCAPPPCPTGVVAGKLAQKTLYSLWVMRSFAFAVPRAMI